MEIVLTDDKYVFLRRIGMTMLAFFSCVGALFGVMLVKHNVSVYRDLLFAIGSNVSLFRRMFVSLVPLILLWLVTRLSLPALFFPICFVKTIIFAACIYVINIVFGRAGWLVSLLLLLPECASVFCAYWVSSQNYPVIKEKVGRELLFCAVVVILASLLDKWCISPLLQLL